jgi:hypothetical protein
MDILLHPSPLLMETVLQLVFQFFTEHAAKKKVDPLTHR